jgi:tryptophan halogenase
MAKPIQNIVILGGGTAGWLSAAYLNRAFGERIKITLVESTRVPRIGVGEATVPTLQATFNVLGMKEEEWMPKCNAAFKEGVRFNNWRKPHPGQTQHTYFHPFFTFPEPPIPSFKAPYNPRFGIGFPLVQHWLKRWMAGDRSMTFGAAANPLHRLCELNKAPKPMPGSGVPDPRLGYAYHFDAALVAEYLRNLATGRGVTHLLADVNEVVLDERGNVQKLRTEQGTDVTGDLFLDCSGFRGIIINQALKEPFRSQNDHLLCDSAVALPSRNTPENLRPYTTANAMGDGWIWEIPLYHRDGTGYVYCGKTTTPDKAEKTLRDFLGPKAWDVPANHIKMRVGYNDRSWVKNCVAVGLSSCFVEPLESTTIFLIEYQLALLLVHFPDMDFDDARVNKYNAQLGEAYEDLRDFIVMHYCLTDRDDTPFWRAVREAPVPDSLKAKLEQYAASIIVPEGTSGRMFPHVKSVVSILSGMDFQFERSAPIVDLVDEAPANEMFRRIEEERERLAAVMPPHYEYLRALHGDHKPSPA